jgi:UDP-glucose 4-epimerase
MAILITGGAGFIGSHTCVEMLNAGREIVVIDNFANSSPKVYDRVRKITGKDFPTVECDIRDEAGLDKVFAAYHIDAVIHFAGLKAVGESVAKPVEYYDNNVGGTVTLLKSMRKAGVKTIVFSSSATVYGSENPVPFKEDMKTGGTTNPYGTTKYMIEIILQDLSKADPEWSVCLLRYFNPIGAHESGLIGDNPNGIPNNLMPYITRVAKGVLPHLNVFGNDYETHDGTGVRDYIHVLDLAAGHYSALKCLDEPGVHIYNLGTGQGYSVLDIINAFERVNGVKIPYIIAPRRAGDIAECFADATKAEFELGWKARRGLDEMCKSAWEFEKKH